MRGNAKGLKSHDLKLVKAGIGLPKYINDHLNKMPNKNKAIKLAILKAFPDLKRHGFQLGEKHLDPDFNKPLRNWEDE